MLDEKDITGAKTHLDKRIIDKMILRLDNLNQEYLVLRERDSRYERWFHEIADKVGITLTP